MPQLGVKAPTGPRSSALADGQNLEGSPPTLFPFSPSNAVTTETTLL